MSGLAIYELVEHEQAEIALGEVYCVAGETDLSHLKDTSSIQP